MIGLACLLLTVLFFGAAWYRKKFADAVLGLTLRGRERDRESRLARKWLLRLLGLDVALDLLSLRRRRPQEAPPPPAPERPPDGRPDGPPPPLEGEVLFPRRERGERVEELPRAPTLDAEWRHLDEDEGGAPPAGRSRGPMIPPPWEEPEPLGSSRGPLLLPEGAGGASPDAPGAIPPRALPPPGGEIRPGGASPPETEGPAAALPPAGAPPSAPEGAAPPGARPGRDAGSALFSGKRPLSGRTHGPSPGAAGAASSGAPEGAAPGLSPAERPPERGGSPMEGSVRRAGASAIADPPAPAARAAPRRGRAFARRDAGGPPPGPDGAEASGFSPAERPPWEGGPA